MNTTFRSKKYSYRTPISPQNKRVRKRHPKKGGNFFGMFLFFTVLFCGIMYCQKYGIFDLNSDIGQKNTLELGIHFSPKRQNILLMGVDAPENPHAGPFKGTRSDTMLLISIAPYGKNINVISIPRDSKVFISGKNQPDKINHAFAFGGARLAVKTVEEVFGIKINNYLAISNSGVVKLIDLLGGLPIYIEKNMKYDDYSAKLHINLKQGTQVLTGADAEKYLRFRHDSYGDIGRIRRQQWFFNALISRLKNPAVAVKLPELLRVMPEYIQTDLSGYELAKYIGMAKNVDPSTIQVATIPGAPSTKGIISYWIIDPMKTQELINILVYRNRVDVINSQISVGILYNKSAESDAEQLREALENQGITVKLQESYNADKDYIALHNLKAAGDFVNDLKKIIPELKTKHTLYDPVGINRIGKDITIVLSGR